MPFLAVWSSVGMALAGESALTKTYQPLEGLGNVKIHIVEVTCHDWYGHGSQPTAIGLISARNVPPTNNPKEAKEDLNLASLCGLRFSAGDIEFTEEVTLDATAFKITPELGYPREDVLKASLECLRRCLPPKLMKTPLTLKTSKEHQGWMGKIIAGFNAHDRKKVFFVPPEN